jgi:RNA-directed DNA polymerase
MKQSRRNHFQELTSLTQLLNAAERSQKGPKSQKGRHYMMTFMYRAEENCLQLQHELRNQSYHPQPYHTFQIRDPKPRLICAAQFRDRVVHHSLCHSLMPVFERYAIEASYACRVGKGTHRAIEHAQHMIKHSQYSLKLDVLHFFETAHHHVLQKLLTRLIRDPATLDLCHIIIQHNPPHSKQGQGLPIGNLSSQHFANLYLSPLDRFIKQKLRVKHYVRYMDDLILCADEAQTLRTWEQEIEHYVHDHLQLKLKASARLLTHNKNGVPYLGYRIWKHHKKLDQARRKRIHRKLHKIYRSFINGDSNEEQLIAALDGIDHWARHAQAHRLIERWHHRHLTHLDDPKSYHRS